MTIFKPHADDVQPPLMLNPQSGTLLTVGAGMEFATLSDALKAAVAGDTIAVKAGTYTNDFSTVNVPVRIIAVGGLVHEVGTIEPPNGKALLMVNADLYIRGFSFSGANDGLFDGNVAGIRYDGGNMQIEYCDFDHNEDGLLATPNVVDTGNILIDHCEFGYNGTGDGYSHNLYVNEVKSLTVTYSYFHDANVGHEIKSRAAQTVIAHNVIADGPTGTASYDIDIPNAGVAVVADNVIEKGPDASNMTAIHYGGETQIVWPTNSLTVTGNSFINDLPASQGIAVWNDAGVQGLSINANISANGFFNYQSARLLVGGPGALAGNTMLAARPAYSTASPWVNAPLTLVAVGPQVLNLSNAGHTITGGAAALSIVDTAGGNTIQGGAGGMALTETGIDEIVTTQAGSTNTLSLTGQGCAIVSNGTDSIVADGLYDSVVVNGQASISGNAYEGFTLNGNDSVTMSGGGNLTLGPSANVTAFVGDNNMYATVTGGAALTVNDGASVARVTGAGATVVTLGTDIHVTAAAGGATVAVAGGVVAGGGGADTYVVQGGADVTATIEGFRIDTDTLSFQGFSGAAIASGTIVGGSTLLSLSDGGSLDIAGVVLPGYGVGGALSNGTLTSSGQSVSGGASLLTITDVAGTNTIAGGAGGLDATVLGSFDSVSTVARSVNQVALGAWDTLTGGGADHVQVTGNYSVVREQGPSSVNVLAYGNAVQGGAGLLTVTDAIGSNSIAGGAGGLVANVTGAYDTVSTAAGASDTVSVAGYTTLNAAGNDRIMVSGLYSGITATGTDSIVSSAPSAGYVLDGTNTLSETGDAWVTVGGAAHVAIGAKGTGTATVVVAAGAHVALSQAMPSGGISWVSVSGGASSISGGGGPYAGIDVTTGGGQAGVAVQAASGDVAVQAQGADTIWAGVGVTQVTAPGAAGVLVYGGAGAVSLTGGAGNDVFVAGRGTATLSLGAGADSVTFGAGATTVSGGAGNDVFTAVAGQGGGHDVINDWSAGDALVFKGFSGNAVAGDVVVGGSTVLSLTDGTVITLVGVAHYQ